MRQSGQDHPLRASFLSEVLPPKQMRKIAGAVKNANDPDLTVRAQKEDQVAPVSGGPQSGKQLVTQRKPIRAPCDVAKLRFNFGHECLGARRAILCDEITDLDEIDSRRRENDQSRQFQALFVYRARSSAKT